MTEKHASAVEALADRLTAENLGAVLRRAVPMSSMTTLRLGGPADLLAEPRNDAEVRAVLAAAHEMGVPVTVVGHGSNLLVRDGGIRGLVVCLERSMRAIGMADDCLTAEGGAMLAAVARAACESGLAGLAFAGGIPGTVGGGAVMNAGAYGGEMSQVVAEVAGFNLHGEPFRYSAEEMGFAHRTSRLQGEAVLITRVTFRLQAGDPVTLTAEMAEYNRRRREKQPLDVPSAGSTFKRPQGGYASALIDSCGLKGLRVGGAQVSEKHAGFCVNLGGTAADFLALMARVQQTVMREKGVALEPEVRIVGEDAPTNWV